MGTSPAGFKARLRQIQAETGSLVCVGLDPDPARIPAHLLVGQTGPEATLDFLTAIIDSTLAHACAYKFNFAFFEALGAPGYAVLKQVRDLIPPDRLTIADAKRGDIGNSSKFYAKSVFDDLRFDAITASPYMGRDSIEPFLQHENTCCFVLVRTSNKGSDDLQLQRVGTDYVYEHIARMANNWAENQPGEIGFVVGATDVDALREMRETFPGVPFLIPGVGAQGGDPEVVMSAAVQHDGLVLVNSSRSILYASSGADFATAAGVAASRLNDSLQAKV